MEEDVNDLSWVEIARRERDAAAPKKREHCNNDISNAELFKRTPTMTFKDIVGEIPEEITRIVHKIEHSEYYEECGLDDTEHEILLIGPPGTGKSSLAEAIATETGRDFYKLPASSLITSYQGSGAGSVRTVFEYVRKTGKPSVIFIDEIDGISNSDMKSNNGESDRAVKELQVQLDAQDPFIICILATNNYENLSPALKDRFANKTITVPLPSYAKRLAILKYYAEEQKLNISKDFLSKLAKLTDQLSCRNLEKLSKEAFNIAFEEQFNSIKKTLDPILKKKKDDEKEKETEAKPEKLVQPFEIKDIHYFVAAYTTQNTKLPSLAMRIVLFNYFFKKQKLNPFPESVAFLSRKTETFAAKDIKAIVSNIRDIFDEKKGFIMSDIYAGLYYDQTINFADSFMRANLFEYYLGGKNALFKHCTKEELCSILAYYTEDNFTGKEISEIVNNAVESAEVENSAITEKHLVVALYKELIKKAKPYVISTSLKTTDLKGFVNRPASIDNIKLLIPNEYPSVRVESRTIIELSKDQTFLESSIYEAQDYKKTRIDFRTKIQPNSNVRYLLIQYFLEDVPHELSLNQINSLAIFTEALSWYSIGGLIKLAKDHAIGNCSRNLKFEHLRDAAYEFDIGLRELKEGQDGCILS